MTNIHDAASEQLLQEQRRVHDAPSTKHGDTARRAVDGAEQNEHKGAGVKKRKAEDEVEGHADKKQFVLRPSPSSMYDRPSTFRPLHLLDRARLPLCYLDTTASESKVAQQRFFTCDADLLGKENSSVPQLLIARLDVDKTLYAVEKVERNTYAVCRLAHWVRPKDLKGDDAGSLPGRVPLHRVSGNATISKRDREGKSKATSVTKIVATIPEPPATESGSNQAPSEAGIPRPWQADEHDLAALEELAAETDTASPPLTQRRMFEKLVCQYMETLYFSKTSLAFFAKGPLSRARAAFTAAEGKLTVVELAAFLRSLCIQSSSLDKKYREKLPEVLNGLVNAPGSDDDTYSKTPVKKKAPRRLHPTRGGMFPLEEDYVQRWWSADHDCTSKSHYGETGEALLRRRLNNVRLRETLLQLIVTLETLALEASPACKSLGEADHEDAMPDHNDEGEAKETSTDRRAKRKKQPQDLNLALDVLVDKLCIWQSIEQDGSEARTPRKSYGSSAGTPSTTQATSSDILRDFFYEVIRPFYLSRLPQQVSMLGKKIGGPAASPLKQPTVKPGAAVVRKAPAPSEAAQPMKQERRSLHRIATDTVAAQKRSKTPSLVRFSSDSAMMPAMKRERSSTPALSSIPLASPTSTTHSRRGSIADFKRLNKRQIDLTALSATADAKQKKKAAIDEQVRNAISTLRKPNRGAAVKDIVDFAENRRAVLVDATPKRVNKFLAVTPHHVAKPVALDSRVVSSSGAVPDTGNRQRYTNPSPAAVRVAKPNIAETPSRSSAWLMPFKDVPIDGRPHDISMSTRGAKPAIFATPSKPRSRDLGVFHDEEQSIFATPLKSAKAAHSPDVLKVMRPSSAPSGSAANIYSALGWDNDLDELS